MLKSVPFSLDETQSFPKQSRSAKTSQSLARKAWLYTKGSLREAWCGKKNLRKLGDGQRENKRKNPTGTCFKSTFSRLNKVIFFVKIKIIKIIVDNPLIGWNN